VLEVEARGGGLRRGRKLTGLAVRARGGKWGRRRKQEARLGGPCGKKRQGEIIEGKKIRKKRNRKRNKK
jgi:hypothetical protein